MPSCSCTLKTQLCVKRGEHFIRTGKGREERALVLLYGHDPKGPRTKLPTEQAGLPWLPAEKFTTTHVPSRDSALGEQRLHWLENGKEKWEFLQAAKQQAITTSQVRRHPSWRSRQDWEPSVGPLRIIIVSIMKTSCRETSWNSHSLLDAERGLDEWSKASAHGAASHHLSLMPTRDNGQGPRLYPTSLPLLWCSLLESPLSHIRLNPVYSSSPNNYCQTLPCQISPNSSRYSPCFHCGLERAPSPLNVVHRPAGWASPGRLLEVQTPGPKLDLLTQNLYLHELPRCFIYTPGCGKRWPVSLVLRVWFLDLQ